MKIDAVELTLFAWDDIPPTKYTAGTTDPTKGAIARDAFLWMSTRDGLPLQGEKMFAEQFKCLQNMGIWCN